MIFDVAFSLVVIGAFVTGYKNGLLTTIIRGAFFILGAVAALYFLIQYNKTGWLIAGVITGAYAAAWVGTQLAKALKVTVVRGPLRWIDSSAGAIFEAAKYVLLFYVIGTILLWAPWAPGQNAVSASKAYLQIDKHAPQVISKVRTEVEKLLANPPK